MISRQDIGYWCYVVAISALEMIAQVVFVRLAVQTFYGNELTITIIMGHWLFWTGIGSLLGSHLLRKMARPFPVIGLVVIYIVVILAASYILFILRKLLGISVSEVVGLGKIFWWTFLIFVIPSIVNGLFFPFLVRWIKQKGLKAPVHFVYIGEVFGAALGSVLFALLIYLGCGSMVSLHLAALGLLLFSLNLSRRSRLLRYLIGAIGLLYGAFFIVKGEALLHRIRWAPLKIISTEESYHQMISEVEYGGSRVIYGNSDPVWSFDVPEATEELVHFPLLQRDSTENVLIIGLATREICTEILKYECVRRITVIQPDRVLQEYLGAPDSAIKSSAVIDVLGGDPYVKIRDLKHKYDMVLLNIPLPVNAMWNRFYTTEFFQTLRPGLSRAAVIALHLPGGENYLTEEHREFLKIIENSVRSAFRFQVWIPGETVHLLASDRPLDNAFDFYKAALKRRSIATLYVNEFYLWDRLSAFRIEQLKGWLNGTKVVQMNTLKRPIGFYYDTILWDQYAGGWLKNLFPYLKRHRAAVVFALFLPLLLLIVLSAATGGRRSVLWQYNIAATGFLVMGLESVLIILFQSFVGGIYFRIIFLTFAYMLGSAFGALFHARKIIRNRHRTFFIIFTILTALTLLSIGVMEWKLPMIFTAVCIYSLMFAVGILAGMIFPLLTFLLERWRREELSVASGSIYAWDILGACWGIYLISALIIPLYGMQTAFELLLIFAGATLLVNLIGRIVPWSVFPG